MRQSDRQCCRRPLHAQPMLRTLDAWDSFESGGAGVPLALQPYYLHCTFNFGSVAAYSHYVVESFVVDPCPAYF